MTLGVTPAAQRGERMENVLLQYSTLLRIRIHFNDVPSSWCPPRHLLITSDVLPLRPSCRVISLTSSDKFLLQSWNSRREIKPVSVFLLHGKPCNLPLVLREPPGSKGTGLKCNIKSCPWNMPVLLIRELCCD